MKAWVVPASASLHVLAVLALLPWPTAAPERADAPPIEVEFVQQPATVQGAAPNDSPAVIATQSAPDPPPPGAEPAPRSAARSRAAPAPAAPPEVNLGNAAEARDDLTVTGQGVVPPAPNSAFRNQPPAYPADAARRGATGTVTLVVQVSAQGVPVDVVVTGSSGTVSLDQAARNAVRRWHFTPARIRGRPVPFDYPLDIRFVIGDGR